MPTESSKLRIFEKQYVIASDGRLCRHIARPAVAIPCLYLNSNGKVVYTLNAPQLLQKIECTLAPLNRLSQAIVESRRLTGVAG